MPKHGDPSWWTSIQTSHSYRPHARCALAHTSEKTWTNDESTFRAHYVAFWSETTWMIGQTEDCSQWKRKPTLLWESPNLQTDTSVIDKTMTFAWELVSNNSSLCVGAHLRNRLVLERVYVLHRLICEVILPLFSNWRWQLCLSQDSFGKCLQGHL